jgi:hypothetical protein
MMCSVDAVDGAQVLSQLDEDIRGYSRVYDLMTPRQQMGDLGGWAMANCLEEEHCSSLVSEYLLNVLLLVIAMCSRVLGGADVTIWRDGHLASCKFKVFCIFLNTSVLLAK